MPVTIERNPDGTFQVRTPNGIHSKHTTLKKAQAQARLLRGVEHGWKPTHPDDYAHEQKILLDKGEISATEYNRRVMNYVGKFKPEKPKIQRGGMRITPKTPRIY